jgi:acetoacetate decarboxylase
MPSASTQGQLTKSRFGFSMPVDAPLYGPPPYAFTNAQIATFVYQTDPGAAADLVPEALQLVSPALATLVIAQYGDSPFGMYAEAFQMIVCEQGSRPILYVARMMVSSVPAMVAGREIWGFPKTLGDLQFTNANGVVSGSATTSDGVMVCSGQMTIGAVIDPATLPGSSVATLRVLPSPIGGAPPELAEIVTLPPSNLDRVWAGTSVSCQVSGASKDHDWASLPIVNIVAANYAQADFELGYGQVLVRL